MFTITIFSYRITIISASIFVVESAPPSSCCWSLIYCFIWCKIQSSSRFILVGTLEADVSVSYSCNIFSVCCDCCFLGCCILCRCCFGELLLDFFSLSSVCLDVKLLPSILTEPADEHLLLLLWFGLSHNQLPRLVLLMFLFDCFAAVRGNIFLCNPSLNRAIL